MPGRPLFLVLSRNSTDLLYKSDGRDFIDGYPRITQAWVKIQLKNNKVYEGWPKSYEDNGTPSEIFLSPACEYEKEELLKNKGAGIIIFEREMATVSFIDREESQCFQLWSRQELEASDPPNRPALRHETSPPEGSPEAKPAPDDPPKAHDRH